MMIRIICALTFLLNSISHSQAQSFEEFLEELRPAALEMKIDEGLFNTVIRDLKPDPSIYKFIGKPLESTSPLGSNIQRNTRGRILKMGRRKIRELPNTLRRIASRYGVDPHVVVAIWGIETGYGRDVGKFDVLRSTATLGWKKHLGVFYGNQFLVALKLMQDDNIPRNKMIGAWTGAMGQSQFLPTIFQDNAVDYDGDGKRDLWGSVGDSLASIANYLAKQGWIKGQPWGVPVKLPVGMPRNVVTQSWSDWAASGVKAFDRKRFPHNGEATLFMPAGAEGPTFLITDNYEIIRNYNSSDSDALSFGLLALRFANRAAFKTSWPTARILDKRRLREVLLSLEKLGFPVSNTVGLIGKDIRFAIRDYQLQKSLVADGHPDRELLRLLRRDRKQLPAGN